MEFYFCSKYLYENLFLSGKIGNKDHTFINDLSGDGNAFSHGKRCKDGSDSQTFDVTEEVWKINDIVCAKVLRGYDNIIKKSENVLVAYCELGIIFEIDIFKKIVIHKNYMR